MIINKESVLIARSEFENKKLSTLLLEQNLLSIRIDMIEYKDLGFNFIDLNKYNYIILTSKYSARIVAQHKIKRNFLIVGKESSNLIKKSNPESKVLSFKNVDEIIDFISSIDKGEIIYLSGSIISREIPNVDRKIIYDTSYLKKIPQSLVNQIKTTQIKYVMVFSKLNLEKLIYIFKTHDIISYIENSIFVCISLNVAKKAKESFQKILYTEIPSQENMIKLITRYEER